MLRNGYWKWLAIRLTGEIADKRKEPTRGSSWKRNRTQPLRVYRYVPRKYKKKRKLMEQYKILDKLVVDAETGEILGEVMDASGGISNLDSLQAILEKRLRLIKQVQAEEQILSFMLENQKKILKRKSSYLNYFEMLWLPLVEQFVKKKLEGAKAKSLDTLFGRVQIRTVKGGLKVEDSTLALAEAHRLGYMEAIKVTESFQISKLTAEQKEVLADSPGFMLTPDREVMSISEPTQEAN